MKASKFTDAQKAFVIKQGEEGMRKIYRDIKDRHGEGKTINVFPVLPVSLAVEAGRVWMPKADLALKLFDHVRDRGFVETFTIGENIPPA